MRFVPRSLWARAALALPLLAVVGLLLWWRGPDWGVVYHAFDLVNWAWVAFALGLNLVSVAVRSVAWKLTIDQALDPPRPRYDRVFSAFSVGLLANAVLPGRIGELARVAVLRRHVPRGRGSSGALVGTVTSICYGSELAWIGMMLVDPELRRQGIGTRLMQRVIDHLRSEGVRTIKLDATPAGRPLYAQLGFHAEHDFQRWRRPAATAADKSVSDAARRKTDFCLDMYAAMDGEAFGADRGRWLQRLASVSHVACRAEGFGMLRPGRIARSRGTRR